jgi:hypothetical protein
MQKLELTQPEAELLREITQEWLSDLRMEIASTDRLDYREALKWKESLLLDVVQRLEGAPARLSSGP